MERLPLAIQNTYSDLLARLQDDAVVDLGGRPVKRTRRGRDYWYVRTYVGNEERERYLGPDTDELRQRIDRLRDKQDEIKARQPGRRALVQMLKVRGVPQIDAVSGKVIQALATSGVFRLRGVLVGTHAFRLYPLILGAQIREAHQSTEDIDIAQFHEIAIGLDDRADPRIQDALATVGNLEPSASLYPRYPTRYRVAGTLVEVLTPNRGPDRDAPVELPALGMHAKPLRFLDFLLADAMPAALPYRYGVLVNVPQPARYAVHKLIVAARRDGVDAAKARKDIQQATALVMILSEDQPDELAERYAEARDRGPQWRDALERGRARLAAGTESALRRALALL
jgi:hypothetical protein